MDFSEQRMSFLQCLSWSQREEKLTLVRVGDISFASHGHKTASIKTEPAMELVLESSAKTGFTPLACVSWVAGLGNEIFEYAKKLASIVISLPEKGK